MTRLNITSILALGVGVFVAWRLGGTLGAGVLAGTLLGTGLSGLGALYMKHMLLTRPEHFAKMEPRIDAWTAIRDLWDPERRIVTAQSVRLFGDRP